MRLAGWCFMRGGRIVYARATSDPASLKFDVVGSEQSVYNFGVFGPKVGHGAWARPSWRCCMFIVCMYGPCLFGPCAVSGALIRRSSCPCARPSGQCPPPDRASSVRNDHATGTLGNRLDAQSERAAAMRGPKQSDHEVLCAVRHVSVQQRAASRRAK